MDILKYKSNKREIEISARFIFAISNLLKNIMQFFYKKNG